MWISISYYIFIYIINFCLSDNIIFYFIQWSSLNPSYPHGKAWHFQWQTFLALVMQIWVGACYTSQSIYKWSWDFGLIVVVASPHLIRNSCCILIWKYRNGVQWNPSSWLNELRPCPRQGRGKRPQLYLFLYVQNEKELKINYCTSKHTYFFETLIFIYFLFVKEASTLSVSLYVKMLRLTNQRLRLNHWGYA